jgi:hypothetical protein
LVGEIGDTLDGGADVDLLFLNAANTTNDLNLDLTISENQLIGHSSTIINNFEVLGAIITGRGNDRILGIANSLTSISTGDGNDTINLGNGNEVDNRPSVDGGGDTDTLIVDFTNANFLGIGAGGWGIANSYIYSNGKIHTWNSGGEPILVFRNIEIFNLRGTAYNDWLAGKAGDTLDGGEGTDFLFLNFKNATSNLNLDLTFTENQLSGDTNTSIKNFEILGEIRTGLGNDFIIGAVNSTTNIYTGEGNDTINLGNDNRVDDRGSVDGGIDEDLLIIDFTNANFLGIGVFGLGVYNNSQGIIATANENKILSFTDVETFNITGTIYQDHLKGDVDDTLDGGQGNDCLYLNLENSTNNLKLDLRLSDR